MATESKRRFVTGVTPPLQVGDRAPRFDLRQTFDQSVSLDTLTSRGPALIAFYVFDFGNI